MASMFQCCCSDSEMLMDIKVPRAAIVLHTYVRKLLMRWHFPLSSFPHSLCGPRDNVYDEATIATPSAEPYGMEAYAGVMCNSFII
mmetsp:Transcript_11027/g.19244  ORF Transcript_11027/g.19244 Transcript_11027/m.19244 type:complete len:86 (+) Transcript_11027:518-775(+)